MGVSSGAGGQSYQEYVTEKIKETKRRYSALVQVDGGINDRNLTRVFGAGADLVVIGSYITKAPDPVQRVKEIEHFLNGD